MAGLAWPLVVMHHILDEDLKENRRQLSLLVTKIDRGGVSGFMYRGLFSQSFRISRNVVYQYRVEAFDVGSLKKVVRTRGRSAP